jgi:hypothetical protein
MAVRIRRPVGFHTVRISKTNLILSPSPFMVSIRSYSWTVCAPPLQRHRDPSFAALPQDDKSGGHSWTAPNPQAMVYTAQSLMGSIR